MLRITPRFHYAEIAVGEVLMLYPIIIALELDSSPANLGSSETVKIGEFEEEAPAGAEIAALAG